METTFHNVTIVINAETSEEAYTKLCNTLASIKAEYCTDMYSDSNTGYEEESTEKLFPKR
jgi:hypothetical protein